MQTQEQEEQQIIKNKEQQQQQQLIKIFQHFGTSDVNLKAFVGLSIINSAYLGGFSLMCYLMYLFVAKRNMKAFFVMYLIVGYTKLYAKKSRWSFWLYRKLQLFKWFKSYQILSEEPLEDQGVMYTWMPHNILAISLLVTTGINDSPFKNTVVLGSRLAIESPIAGTIMKWAGFQGVNPENFKNLMDKRQNILFVPGGFEEATLTSHKEYRILADRKGFIKYGLQKGYTICPIFTFNENKGYKTSDMLLNIRLWLNKFKIPGALFFSKFGILPDNDIDVVVIIGKKVELPKIENPSQEDINKYHLIYVEEIRKLFDRYAPIYHPGSKLKFYSQEQDIQQYN